MADHDEVPLCPSCGSDRVVSDLRVIDQASGAPVQLAIDRRPEAMLRKQTHRVGLLATVCGACGHTQWRATRPDTIWRIHLAATRENECDKCGFDLRGHSGQGLCPECGDPFERPPDEPAHSTSDTAGRASTAHVADEITDIPCPKCGEPVPLTFTDCWNCGISMSTG